MAVQPITALRLVKLGLRVVLRLRRADFRILLLRVPLVAHPLTVIAVAHEIAEIILDLVAPFSDGMEDCRVLQEQTLAGWRFVKTRLMYRKPAAPVGALPYRLAPESSRVQGFRADTNGIPESNKHSA